MFSIRSVSAAAALFMAMPLAHAGATTSTHIVTVTADQGAFFIYVDKQPSTVPACATTTTSNWRYAIDISSAIGKAQMATALSAQARGATVTVSGWNDCRVWSDAEAVQFLMSN